MDVQPVLYGQVHWASGRMCMGGACCDRDMYTSTSLMACGSLYGATAAETMLKWGAAALARSS